MAFCMDYNSYILYDGKKYHAVIGQPTTIGALCNNAYSYSKASERAKVMLLHQQNAMKNLTLMSIQTL